MKAWPSTIRDLELPFFCSLAVALGLATRKFAMLVGAVEALLSAIPCSAGGGYSLLKLGERPLKNTVGQERVAGHPQT